ncbi:hypothetical protein BV20DRAFT_674685 [Pilatotrama ljubarskyi]|nr:hypothetical protein BV20DRAFT_674685 [Pilatotrama ljubarskyi]
MVHAFCTQRNRCFVRLSSIWLCDASLGQLTFGRLFPALVGWAPPTLCSGVTAFHPFLPRLHPGRQKAITLGSHSNFPGWCCHYHRPHLPVWTWPLHLPY